MRYVIKSEKDKEAAADHIMKLSTDKRTVVEIKASRAQRSLPQNKLYRLWLKCLSEEIGHSPDELHEHFKCGMLGKEPENWVLGINIAKPRSTKYLDTKEFTEYLENIKRYAFDNFNCILPEPGDLGWSQFEERYS